MPDPKLYFSYLELPDGSKKYVKDIDAREEIAEVKETIKNGSKYIGKLVSATVGGQTVTTFADGDAPTSITTDMGTFVTGTPSTGETALNNGDYVIVVGTGTNPSLEFMWTGTKLSEFGSTSVLKGLAYKDSASGSYTPAGTNQASAVTFTGQTDGDFVTGFDTDPVLPSFTEGAFTQGTLPSFTEGAFTPASLGTGFYSAGTAASFTEGAFSAGTLPSFTEGAFSQGTLPSKEADTWDAGTLPSFSEGAFSAGALASLTYDSTNEGLVFAAGTLPSKAADTWSAGSLPSYTEGTFSQGTLPSKTADTWSAGTLPSKQSDTFVANTPAAIDVTKFNGGSKASDTFDAGTLPTKASDTFSAGTAPTLATGKAITAVGTGEAAAQTFTGTAATITVS